MPSYCKNESHIGEKKRSRFGYPGGKREACSEHKKDGMINFDSPICEICKKKTAIFGDPITRIYSRCNEDKKDDMINLTAPRCPGRPGSSGCGKEASYGNGKREFCASCKEEDMKTTRKMCQGHEECGLFPNFGFKGGSKTHCSEHKLENMIRLGIPRCECDKRAFYNFKGEKTPSHCINCKKSKMINIFTPKCISCKFIEASFQDPDTKKNKQYCSSCLYFLSPNSRAAKIHRNKEFLVVDEIRKYILGIEIIHNRVIKIEYESNEKPSGRRPDVLIKFEKYSLIVEIDEFQHKSYTEECEIIRNNNLVSDLGYKPLVMIRFNPDKYKNEEGKTIISSVKNSKETIVPAKGFDERIQTLIKEINFWINNPPEDLFIQKCLYYDHVEE